MSRKLTGYTGEGKHRRGVYADEGPASVSASSPFAMHGRLSALQIPETAGEIEMGAGRIERRQITDDERSAREPAPSPIGRVSVPFRETPAEVQAHRIRGGETRRSRVVRAEDLTPPQRELVTQLVNAKRDTEGLPPIRLAEPESPVTPEEIAMPVVPETPEDLEGPATEPDPSSTLGTRIAVVAEAAALASDAWSELQMAAEAERAAGVGLAAAEERWDQARAALEESWRATGILFVPPAESPADIPEIIPEAPSGAASFDAAVQRAFDGSGVEVRTSFTPTDEPADTGGAAARMAAIANDRAARVADHDAEAAEQPAAAGPGPLSRQQMRVLESALRHGGDFTAIAREVGCSRQNARGALDAVGRKGLLPVELIPRLPASFAKYTPAVG